ncbi:sulfatase [Halosimplex salinum]|uniref:sulfatase n=1 Tax=Halosimplex salinum TaxID=1710538 RepID=UPI0013DDD51B|nr:sulfatase [Halosimplex salinum]
MTRNVVLVTYDSLRADHCGHWGYERDTSPNLDAMAETGVVYENAIAPASRTNPSMAGILTGEPMVFRDQVSNPEIARSHLERHGTLAERLRAEGYATGAFCPNAYASKFYGFDRGFDRFEDFMFDNSRYQDIFQDHLGDSGFYTLVRNLRNFVFRQEAFKTWDSYIDEMVEWANDQTEPFFLWAFSLDTHFPYLTPRTYRQWSNLFDQYYYNWRCNQLINEFDIDISEREVRKIVDIYDDSIRFGDVLLAELLDRLSAFDPVIVVHGDHGEAFDERGIYGHFFPSLYEENVHVPFVVEDGESTGTVDRPVSLVDLPDVVTRAAGVEDGSLTDIGDDYVVATDYDGRNDRDITAVRSRRFKYIRRSENGDENRELYDLGTDRGETENLVETHDIGDTFGALADRRASHESELLGIQRAAAGLHDEP